MSIAWYEPQTLYVNDTEYFEIAGEKFPNLSDFHYSLFSDKVSNDIFNKYYQTIFELLWQPINRIELYNEFEKSTKDLVDIHKLILEVQNHHIYGIEIFIWLYYLNKSNNKKIDSLRLKISQDGGIKVLK